MARVRKAVSTLFDAITVEGSLISSAVLARIAARDAGAQSEADYDVPKGLTLRDEIARFFRIGQALFTDLFASSTPSRVATIAFTGCANALMCLVFRTSIGVREPDSRRAPVQCDP